MKFTLRGRLAIETSKGPLLTDTGADLLEQIEAIGSLTDAARRLDLSYRHAWSLIKAMNQRAGAAVVELRTGGRRGGGATLTEKGVSLLRCFRLIQAQMQQLLDENEPLVAQTLKGGAAPPRWVLEEKG